MFTIVQPSIVKFATHVYFNSDLQSMQVLKFIYNKVFFRES